MPRPVDDSPAQLLRELTPQVVGTLVRRHRDFAAAEDAVQEALLAATLQWPRDGLPDNPRAWLLHVATRRLTDQQRSEAARKRREQVTVAEAEHESPAPGDELPAHDDTLVLLFMCCHPVLSPTSAIALMLRAVGGLGTAEIARAFLVPEATMAQRISRAKQSIRSSGVPFSLPTADERSARLGQVLHVLYLSFSEGYSTSSGPTLQRRDLASEAIRLTRALHRGLPEHAEVAGLLALMLLTDARRDARSGPDGELIPLPEQDRSRWDRDAIAEGTALLDATLPRGEVGPYQLQAAIAALHDEAATHEATDWPQILALYGVLLRMSDNPMAALSHAIATAMVHGPAAGLARLQALADDPRLAHNHRLDAVRAHLLEQAGDPARAIHHYLAAANRTASAPERDYLQGRAARLRPT
ncbi:MAG: RNA polymerase sigma factor [Myxococcales bacterium]|nr:RNA polymerase sigma factor [Myxococcales bacterium]